MITLYKYDSLGYATGEAVEVDERSLAPIPSRTTNIPPPELQAGEYARIIAAGRWEITTTAPNYEEAAKPLPEKLVPAKDLVQVLPMGTEYKLRALVAAIDPAKPETLDDGFKADRALTLLTGGESLNVNSPAFDYLANWMVEQPTLDINQSHIDQVK